MRFVKHFWEADSSQDSAPDSAANLAPDSAQDSALNPRQDWLFSEICDERAAKMSGYYDLPFESSALDAAKSYLKANAKILKNLKNLVIIGIGGSSLGLKALDSALCHLPCRKKITLTFLEHTDPICIEDSLKNIRAKNALFVVISKSGATVETISLFKFVLQKFNFLGGKNGANPPKNPQKNRLKIRHKNRLCIITDCDSPLSRFGAKHEIYTISINQNIGGRFSALSAVGLVPLAILGYDVGAILGGARGFLERFFAKKENHILQKALFLGDNAANLPITVLFSYSSIFKDFNAWFVQLWAESLGKVDESGAKSGLTPIALIGSIDQHSFLQAILQGRRDKTITFLRLKLGGAENESKNEGENGGKNSGENERKNGEKSAPKSPKIPRISLDFLEKSDFLNGLSFEALLKNQQIATMKSLGHEIPSDCIEVDLSERDMGALVVYFELLTSCVARVLRLNAYDQPAVEWGKKILFNELGGA